MPYTQPTDWYNYATGTFHYYFSQIESWDTAFYMGYTTDPDTVIIGSAGREIINAGGGDDVLVGAGGNDSLNGGGGDDRVSGGDGDDWVVTSDGDDILNGDAGIDMLSLTGKSGHGWNVSLQNEFGYQIVGQFFSASAEINTAEIYGFENVTGTTSADYIEGNDLNNKLWDGNTLGQRDDDIIWGLGGNDDIRIHGGSDQVDGGAGDDDITVRGFNMDDHQLTGGDGADVFHFDVFESQSGQVATITDFDWREGDRIEVSDDFRHDWSGGTASGFEGQNTVWATNANGTGTLWFDDNGDREADYWVDVVMEGGDNLLVTADVLFV